MNGGKKNLKGERVESIKLTGIMGGVELDLTEAQLADHVTIQVYSLMSGVVIKVPPMVEVRDDSRCIMSGVANMVPRYNTAGLPMIHVNADCVMSGVSIKVVCGQ